jgi:hypothetical protein
MLNKGGFMSTLSGLDSTCAYPVCTAVAVCRQPNCFYLEGEGDDAGIVCSGCYVHEAPAHAEVGEHALVAIAEATQAGRRAGGRELTRDELRLQRTADGLSFHSYMPIVSYHVLERGSAPFAIQAHFFQPMTVAVNGAEAGGEMQVESHDAVLYFQFPLDFSLDRTAMSLYQQDRVAKIAALSILNTTLLPPLLDLIISYMPPNPALLQRAHTLMTDRMSVLPDDDDPFEANEWSNFVAAATLRTSPTIEVLDPNQSGG